MSSFVYLAGGNSFSLSVGCQMPESLCSPFVCLNNLLVRCFHEMNSSTQMVHCLCLFQASLINLKHDAVIVSHFQSGTL